MLDLYRLKKCAKYWGKKLPTGAIVNESWMDV